MQAIVSHTLASHLLCGLLGRFKELMESGLAKGERILEFLHAVGAAFGVSRALFCFCSKWEAPPRASLFPCPHRARDTRPHHNESPSGRHWEAQGRVERAQVLSKAGNLPRCPPPPTAPPPPLVGPMSLCRNHTSQTSISPEDLKPPHVA